LKIVTHWKGSSRERCSKEWSRREIFEHGGVDAAGSKLYRLTAARGKTN